MTPHVEFVSFRRPPSLFFKWQLPECSVSVIQCSQALQLLASAVHAAQQSSGVEAFTHVYAGAVQEVSGSTVKSHVADVLEGRNTS